MPSEIAVWKQKRVYLQPTFSSRLQDFTPDDSAAHGDSEQAAPSYSNLSHPNRSDGHSEFRDIRSHSVSSPAHSFIQTGRKLPLILPSAQSPYSPGKCPKQQTTASFPPHPPSLFVLTEAALPDSLFSGVLLRTQLHEKMIKKH